MRFNGFEEFQEYPKLLYSKEGTILQVANLAEEQKAGPVWQFSPAGSALDAPEIRRGRGRPRHPLN